MTIVFYRTHFWVLSPVPDQTNVDQVHSLAQKMTPICGRNYRGACFLEMDFSSRLTSFFIVLNFDFAISQINVQTAQYGARGSRIFRYNYAPARLDDCLQRQAQLQFTIKGRRTNPRFTKSLSWYDNLSSVSVLNEITLCIYQPVLKYCSSAADTLKDVVDNYTISEWIEQRIYPYMVALEKIQNQSLALKNVKYWPARPLPILKDLQRHGVVIN